MQGESKGKEKSPVRFVGGAVRNALLGLPCKDVDLATSWTPLEVALRLQARGLRVVPTGLAHGTVRVVGRSDGDEAGGGGDRESCEITTLRRDAETGRWTGFHSSSVVLSCKAPSWYRHCATRKGASSTVILPRSAGVTSQCCPSASLWRTEAKRRQRACLRIGEL